jgi:hypothetical protein
MSNCIRFGDISHSPKTDVRVLGVQIDSKLCWKPHINQVKTKAIGCTKSLSRIITSTWGACFTWARRLYTAIVYPALSYAAPVWYTPDGLTGHRKWMTKQLEKVHNSGPRMILGAYRIPILEHEAQIPPVDTLLESTIMNLQGRQTMNKVEDTIQR